MSSKENLRKLEREYQATGDPELHHRYLREKCRQGDCCGHSEPDTIPIPRPSEGALKVSITSEIGRIRGIPSGLAQAVMADEEVNPASLHVTLGFHGHRPYVEQALEWFTKTFQNTHRNSTTDLGVSLGFIPPETSEEKRVKAARRSRLAADLGLSVDDLEGMARMARGEAEPDETIAVAIDLNGEAMNSDE